MDRLLKDIVAETALNYVSKYPENVDLTFNSYGSEHWHERRPEGDAFEGKFPQSSYHYRQHALLHGAGSVAAKTIGVPIREGNQVRSHPLEDSPVLASQDMPLPIPVSLSGQQGTGSLPQPRSQGSVASTTSYLARPQSGVFQPMISNTANLTDEPKGGIISGERTDSPANTRDTSPHGLGTTNSANSKVGPVSTPALSSGAVATGHHRILSTHSAVPSTQVNHLSVNASSASQHSTSPTPSQGHLSSGNAAVDTGRGDAVGSTKGESSGPASNQQSQRTSSSAPRLAFSLAKFIPLLSERIYVISPFTRSHLVSWIMILDSVPDLELVSYLPEFLDGLL